MTFSAGVDTIIVLGAIATIIATLGYVAVTRLLPVSPTLLQEETDALFSMVAGRCPTVPQDVSWQQIRECLLPLPHSKHVRDGLSGEEMSLVEDACRRVEWQGVAEGGGEGPASVVVSREEFAVVVKVPEDTAKAGVVQTDRVTVGMQVAV